MSVMFVIHFVSYTAAHSLYYGEIFLRHMYCTETVLQESNSFVLYSRLYWLPVHPNLSINSTPWLVRLSSVAKTSSLLPLLGHSWEWPQHTTSVALHQAHITKACGTNSASDWLENMGEPHQWQPASSHHLAGRQPGHQQVQASQPTPLSNWQDASSHQWRGRLTTCGRPATPLINNWQRPAIIRGEAG